MIIFGFKQLTKLLATLSYVCSSCHQPAAHRIFTRWSWFSLFFIPVIPLGTKKYYDTCIACGRTVRLTKEQALGIVGQPPVDPAQAQIDPRHGQASPALGQQWGPPAQAPQYGQPALEGQQQYGQPPTQPQQYGQPPVEGQQQGGYPAG